MTWPRRLDLRATLDRRRHRRAVDREWRAAAVSPDASTGLWRAFRRFVGAIPPVPPQALAMFHLSVGGFILAGDGVRFSGPSFVGARQLATVFGVPAGKAWVFWGVLLLVTGLAVLFTWPWLELRHARVAVCVVLFGAAPMMFIVLGFITSLRLSEIASTSGIGAYGALVLAHLHTGAKMIRHGCWDRRRPDGTWERRSSVQLRGSR